MRDRIQRYLLLPGKATFYGLKIFFTFHGIKHGYDSFLTRLNLVSESFDSTQLMTHSGFTRIDSNQLTAQSGFLKFDSNRLVTQKPFRYFDSDQLMTQKTSSVNQLLTLPPCSYAHGRGLKFASEVTYQCIVVKKKLDLGVGGINLLVVLLP